MGVHVWVEGARYLRTEGAPPPPPPGGPNPFATAGRHGRDTGRSLPSPGAGPPPPRPAALRSPKPPTHRPPPPTPHLSRPASNPLDAGGSLGGDADLAFWGEEDIVAGYTSSGSASASRRAAAARRAGLGGSALACAPSRNPARQPEKPQTAKPRKPRKPRRDDDGAPGATLRGLTPVLGAIGGDDISSAGGGAGGVHVAVPYLGDERELGVGEIFGELSFFTDIPQMATVR
jgi:hypothetical protein